MKDPQYYPMIVGKTPQMESLANQQFHHDTVIYLHHKSNNMQREFNSHLAK